MKERREGGKEERDQWSDRQTYIGKKVVSKCTDEETWKPVKSPA